MEGGRTIKIADLQRGAHALLADDGRLVAKALGFKGDDIYRFALLASRVDRSISPDDILDAVKIGQIPPNKALKLLIPFTAHSYQGLADSLEVSVNQLRGWVGNQDGRISVPEFYAAHLKNTLDASAINVRKSRKKPEKEAK